MENIKLNIGSVVFLEVRPRKHTYTPNTKYDLNFEDCDNKVFEYGNYDNNIFVCKYLGKGVFEEMLTGLKMRLDFALDYDNSIPDYSDEDDMPYISSNYEQTLENLEETTDSYSSDKYYNDLEKLKEFIKVTPILIDSNEYGTFDIDDEVIRNCYFATTDEQKIDYLMKVKNECEESAAKVIAKIDETIDKRQYQVPTKVIKAAYFDNQVYDFQNGKARN